VSDVAMWSAVVGFFLPIVAQFITRVTPNRATQSLIGTGCCAIAAVVTVVLAPHTGSLTVQQFTKAFAVTFAVAMSSYEHLWKPTGVAPTTTGASAPTTPAQ
jgi:hypothetical protein